MTKAEVQAIFEREYSYREVLRIATPCYSPAIMGVAPITWRGTLWDIARLQTPPKGTRIPYMARRDDVYETRGRTADLGWVLNRLLEEAGITEDIHMIFWWDQGAEQGPVTRLGEIRRALLAEAS